MQITRTNAVFSRTVLVSRFCAEIQLSGKSSEFMQKVLFSQNIGGARRASQVEARGPHTIGRRAPHAGRAALWLGRLVAPLRILFGLLEAPWKNKTLGVDFVQFREYFLCRISETKNSRKQQLALRHLIRPKRIYNFLCFMLLL